MDAAWLPMFPADEADVSFRPTPALEGMSLIGSLARLGLPRKGRDAKGKAMRYKHSSGGSRSGINQARVLSKHRVLPIVFLRPRRSIGPRLIAARSKRL
jgi:hypothetical protein